MELEKFILDNEGTDPARLLLSRDRWPDVDMDLAVSTIESRKTLREKVPEWYRESRLLFPKSIGAQQCSSSATASYKASLAASLCGGGGFTLADLTGGFGVDSWAFGKEASKVIYNEADPSLADAARHNFPILGTENVVISSKTLVPRAELSGPEAATVGEILAGAAPDIIYLDPSRRDSAGRKVFLMEDCRPDVCALVPELLEAAPIVILKLSPMMDISLAIRDINHAAGKGAVTEMHVVSAGGECKELLAVLRKDSDVDEESVKVIVADGPGRFSFTPEQERTASARPVPSPEHIVPGTVMFVPGKGLSKAGAFNLVSSRSGLLKAGRSTHIYFGLVPETLRPMGKCFIVNEVLHLDKKTLKETGRRHPRAEVSARNIPLDSEGLRRRLGCRPGGGEHIFGVRLEPSYGASGNFLLVCSLSPEK